MITLDLNGEAVDPKMVEKIIEQSLSKKDKDPDCLECYQGVGSLPILYSKIINMLINIYNELSIHRYMQYFISKNLQKSDRPPSQAFFSMERRSKLLFRRGWRRY